MVLATGSFHRVKAQRLGWDVVDTDDSSFVKTVLIVDDTQEGRAAIGAACSGIPGKAIEFASSAVEAVRLLENGGRPVCAIITDIRMPRMDGFELIEFIRAHPRYRALPIIVVTADTERGTPERVSRLGANAFFSKPFSARAIRRKLEELTHEQ